MTGAYKMFEYKITNGSHHFIFSQIICKPVVLLAEIAREGSCERNHGSFRFPPVKGCFTRLFSLQFNLI